MTHRSRALLVVATMFALLLSSTTAFAQFNGAIDILYLDPLTGRVDSGACQGAAIFFPPFTAIFFAEVHFRLNGVTAAGISGAEFFIKGIEPTGWEGSFAPVEGTVWNGSFTRARDTDGDNVPETRRGNLSFTAVMGPAPEDGCQCGDGRLVKLGVFRMSQFPVQSPVPDDTWLQIVAGDPPSNPAFNCPLVTLCDAPIFTSICVSGGWFLINPSSSSCEANTVEQGTWRECEVSPVVENDWGAIKRLYRSR